MTVENFNTLISLFKYGQTYGFFYSLFKCQKGNYEVLVGQYLF